MSIKTLAVQALFVLLVVYQTPAVAGEIQGNVLNCTNTLQTLDVTIGDVTTTKDIPTTSSGTGKSTKCSGRIAMQILYSDSVGLPADISANFHYEYQNPDLTTSTSSVVCFGRLEAGATSVDINLLNYSTCSFGRPRPAKG